jgi:hypothetical protein
MTEKQKNNENTALKSYIKNAAVFNQIRTHYYIIIGARSVVTTRLWFAVGVDTLKIIMNFIIISREGIPRTVGSSYSLLVRGQGTCPALV